MIRIFNRFFKKIMGSSSSHSIKSIDNSTDFFVAINKINNLKNKNEQISILLKFLAVLEEIDIAKNREDIDKIIYNNKEYINILILNILEKS